MGWKSSWNQHEKKNFHQRQLPRCGVKKNQSNKPREKWIGIGICIYIYTYSAKKSYLSIDILRTQRQRERERELMLCVDKCCAWACACANVYMVCACAFSLHVRVHVYMRWIWINGYTHNVQWDTTCTIYIYAMRCKQKSGNIKGEYSSHPHNTTTGSS